MEIVLALILPVLILSWIVAAVGRRAWIGFLHLLLTPVLIGALFFLFVQGSESGAGTFWAAVQGLGIGYLASFVLHLAWALSLRSRDSRRERSAL